MFSPFTGSRGRTAGNKRNKADDCSGRLFFEKSQQLWALADLWEQRNNLYYMRNIKIKEKEDVCVCHTRV